MNLWLLAVVVSTEWGWGFFLGGGFLPFVYNNDDSKRLSLVKYIIDVEHRDTNNFPHRLCMY